MDEQQVIPNVQEKSEDRCAGETDAPEKAGRSRLFVLQDFFQLYPRADISQGLSFCGEDMDAYLEILKAFGEDMGIEELNACYAQRDAENYEILVHGVKSAARGIGFTVLSEQARSLEEAAKKGDWDFINERHGEFLAEYRAAAQAILQTVAQGGA